VNCLQDEKEENCNSTAKSKNGDNFANILIEPECETRRVPLDQRVLEKAVLISQDLSSNEETELLSFLDKK
jgi:hypothetical protein